MCSKPPGDFCTSFDTTVAQKVGLCQMPGCSIFMGRINGLQETPMKNAAAFNVEGLVKGYLRGTAWHCTFYTPAGRQRRKLGS